MKEECIDVKRFDALISHEEWWCYDLFATAASLALKVPHFCCDWTLSHFVVAQGYWSSSNAVMECAPEKLTVIQAAEEKMIEAAFRGRHCWSEKCAIIWIATYFHTKFLGEMYKETICVCVSFDGLECSVTVIIIITLYSLLWPYETTKRINFWICGRRGDFHYYCWWHAKMRAYSF